MERRIFRCIRIRRGPNRFGFFDILWPFRDAVRLFCREQCLPLVSNCVLLFSPVFWYVSFFV
jgi:NADH:ubiquinone oxidoreductase subunit H